MPTRTAPEKIGPPTWIKPELANPGRSRTGGHRLAARNEAGRLPYACPAQAGRVKIITRRGNDWADKYPSIARALASLPTKSAYLDGELCGVLPNGRTAFNLIQNALEHGDASLVYFVFDLLFLDGENLTGLPLVDRKTRLEAFLVGAPDAIRYSDHQIGHGPEFYRIACQHGLESIVSKRLDGRYEPDRRSWLKTKCLNRRNSLSSVGLTRKAPATGLAHCFSVTTPQMTTS
jgi:bifunctional non-homologous end joining protein LigD